MYTACPLHRFRCTAQSNASLSDLRYNDLQQVSMACVCCPAPDPYLTVFVVGLITDMMVCRSEGADCASRLLPAPAHSNRKAQSNSFRRRVRKGELAILQLSFVVLFDVVLRSRTSKRSGRLGDKQAQSEVLSKVVKLLSKTSFQVSLLGNFIRFATYNLRCIF